LARSGQEGASPAIPATDFSQPIAQCAENININEMLEKQNTCLIIHYRKENIMEIKIGDLVTFKMGLYADEEGAVYRVLEINGDRGMLELLNTNMIIRPQSVAILSELDLSAEQGKLLSVAHEPN